MAGSREVGRRTWPEESVRAIGSSKPPSITSRNKHAGSVSHEMDGPMSMARSSGLEMGGRFAGGKTWSLQLDKSTV